MIAEIGTGLSSLKAALDLAKGLGAAGNQAMLNESKIALQGHILEAQGALAAAREASFGDSERIRQLEQQIAEFNDWDREKQRYELKEVGRGAFAYVMRTGMENGEPQHWLCSNCFGNRRKSIYQKLPGSSTQTHLRIPTSYECATCKSKISP